MTKDYILLVEDNPEIRDSVTSILEVNGFDVHAAADGKEALNILQDSPRSPDVIISDIRMPELDGYEFLKIVRGEEQLHNVPFIFLTALGEDHQITYGYNQGIDAYIIKPFKPDQLLAAVRSRILRSRQIQNFANRQLERTRYTLLQVLSHELRTPLTYVMGGISLLEEELKSNGSQNSVMGVIHSGTRRLMRLAEQTSILGELVSGYAATHWEQIGQPTMLSGVVNEAVGMITPLAADKNITIDVQPMPRLPIFGIHGMLVKGVYEVLHNSVQYSEKGLTVTVSGYEEDSRAIIRVEDKGRGISPEDLDKVWNLMVQSQRDVYEHQGMGLGLTLTKGIFEVHGGDAEITSQPDEGTTVWLQLPLYDETQAAANTGD